MIRLTTLVTLALMSYSLALKITETVKTEANIDQQIFINAQSPQTITAAEIASISS